MTEIHLYQRSGKRVKLATIHRELPHNAVDGLRFELRKWCKTNHRDPDDIEMQTRDPATGGWNSYYTK